MLGKKSSSQRMAFFAFICLLLFLSRLESCFIPHSTHVVVPQSIEAGYRITTVEVSGCDQKSTPLNVTDSSFRIEPNGDIMARNLVEMGRNERTFSVLALDSRGVVTEMKVHLVAGALQGRKQQGEVILRRVKRRWSPPPFNILENDMGPFPRDIEKIVSDSEVVHTVFYTINGPGYDENPFGVFSLDEKTGMLTVHKSVDREEFPSFTLLTNVFDSITRKQTDDTLPITIIVDDVNDNKPIFDGPLQLTVLEQGSVGTVVGKVNATDRDEAGTLHVKIKYTLLTGLELFAIHPQTGVITTVTGNLDREVKDKHTMTVQIKDMDGAVNGLFNTGTATITLGDINDNPPTFKKQSFEAIVKENEIEKLIIRIPVDDKDLINTPNWISKFVITKGNKNGNFRIDTDPKTNEGLLYVSKALNYELTKEVTLDIMARNEADLSGTTAQWNTVPVRVTVSNVDEGPEFTPPIKRIPVKENTPNGTVIGHYTALDPETMTSDGISYYKTSDPGSWISVDKNNGELKITNTVDRESPLVRDGLYNVSIKAVDASAKTGMGKVIIVVEDVNDNMPTFPSKEMVLCEKEGELSSLLVKAEDNDQSPFSSPFTFSLPREHDGKWSVTKFNDTTATLKQAKDLPNGIYNVPVDVKDLQGFGKTQMVEVRICECSSGACLARQSSVSLGPLALLAILLPLALLLLLCLLLAFFCATEREKLEFEDTGDSGGILLKSNTEAPGEEVDSSLINLPVLGGEQPFKGSSIKGSRINTGWQGNKSSSTLGAHMENGMYKTGVVTSDVQDYYSGQYGTQQFNGGQLIGSGVDFDNRFLAQNSGYNHLWLTNGLYLQQKLPMLEYEEERYADDIIHGYKFEGTGSAAGSIGCCSDHDDKDDLNFLNTLGPKFKNLAVVCKKT